MSKRKLDEIDDAASADDEIKMVSSRFISETGEVLGESCFLPINSSVKTLHEVCNNLLNHETPLPLTFYINSVEVVDTLKMYLDKDFNFIEDTVNIVYQPQALFKVRAITRCTGSIEGSKSFFSCSKVL